MKIERGVRHDSSRAMLKHHVVPYVRGIGVLIPAYTGFVFFWEAVRSEPCALAAAFNGFVPERLRPCVGEA